MNRRTFIQGLGVLAATPALSKYLNLFKSGGVREGITQAIDKGMDKGMDFYNLVIKKVVDEGTVIKEEDRFRTYTHPDRPDISVEVNVGTGDSAVYFDTDQGSKGFAEITSDIEAPKAGKELIEGEEVYKGMGPDGDYYKDVEEGEIRGGLTSLEEWIKMKRGYAAGGRVGMWKGGVPKGLQAALRLIRSKFGDDAIMNANSSKRKLTNDELEDFEMEIGDALEGYDFDGTVGNAERILKEQKAYEADMFLEYKKGNLDPVAGDKSPARKRFLEKKLEDMEASGDSRLMTREEIEELSSFDLGTEMDNSKSIIPKDEYKEYRNDFNKEILKMSPEDLLRDEFPGIDDRLVRQILTDKNPQRIAEVKQTMREALEMQNKGMSVDEIIELFKNTTRTKQANGGIIGLTNNPMTASSKAGVESLFERR